MKQVQASTPIEMAACAQERFKIQEHTLNVKHTHTAHAALFSRWTLFLQPFPRTPSQQQTT